MRQALLLCGFILLILIMVTPLGGCGGETKEAPLAPQSLEPALPGTSEHKATSKRPWGIWTIRCEDATDDTPASVEAIPARAGEVHLDVTEFLLPPQCTNCLDVLIMGVEGLEWTIHVKLTNPTIYTAYDVTGIFPGTDGPTVLVHHGYTNLFDIDGDSNTRHPFLAFETGMGNREWGPGKSYGQTIIFRREEGERFADLTYVVAASWPENQDEVVQLINPHASGRLYTDASNPVDFTVEVLDWQEDVEYVLINLDPVNGSAYTHMEPIENDLYRVYSYAAWGLSPGSADLLIAAKSLGADNITYNYLTVEIIDPPPPPTNWAVFSGPTPLTGDGAPTGELDLAVVGQSGETSSTLVHASSTQVYAWDETYTESTLFVTVIDTGGTDPNFPIEPVMRIAAPHPIIPDAPATFVLLETNLDTDIWDETTTPPIPYRDTMQLLDLQNLQVIDFKLTADKPETPELDAIMRPMDVSCGVNADKYGYALWAPDGGEYPTYYPYVALVRYEPPYKDETDEYDTLIGGVLVGAGDGKLPAQDITGLAVWDGGGEDNLVVAVSEGGTTNEVELFAADYLGNPGGLFTPIVTLSGFVGTPIDVAILPVGDAGLEDENWVLILTEMKTIEAYTLSGEFVESFLDNDALPYTPRHMDVDLENLRIHVMMQGPVATVIQYTGD